jgi:hypothetical protein
MNNRRLLYYPVVLYALLLFFVWVASWIMGIAELLIAPSLNVENLLSAEGMRWALRTAAASVDAARMGCYVHSAKTYRKDSLFLLYKKVLAVVFSTIY